MKFTKIKDYPSYGITTTGLVKNFISGEILEGSINPAGYCHYRLTNDSGTKTIGRHRLMMIVYKPVKNMDSLVVNHIDGIKGRDVLSNLEWVTYLGNLEHAGEMGLTEKCKPIVAKDFDSDHLYHFKSIKEAAKAFGYTYDAMKYRVKTDGQKVFPEMMLYKEKHSESEWMEVSTKEVALAIAGTTKAVLVRDVITKEVTGYDSIKDAQKALGVGSTYISEWLAVPDHPTSSIFKQFKYLLDERPWREFDDPYVDYERFNSYRVIMTEDQKGDRKLYIGLNAACAATGLKKTTCDFRCKSKLTKVYSDGMKYCYYTDLFGSS